VPLRALEVTDFTARHAVVLLGALPEGRLRRLVVSGEMMDGLAAMSRSAAARGVRELWAGYGADANRVAELVAGSADWGGLRVLDLWAADELSADAAEALFRAPHLRQLTELRLEGGTSWPLRTVRALAEARWKELRHLELVDCGLDDEAARLLAGCAALRQLRRLELSSSRLTGAGLTALLTSPHLRKLAVLNLSGNRVSGLDGAALAGAGPGRLRALDLSFNRPSAADLTALLSSPAARALTALDLQNCGLGTAAGAALAAAPPLKRLAVLTLLYNRLGDRGARALAGWPGLRSVHCLHLNNTSLAPAGALALAASPHAGRLLHFCVNEDEVGAEAVRALRRRYGKALVAY
jgi:hypothetical protein